MADSEEKECLHAHYQANQYGVEIEWMNEGEICSNRCLHCHVFELHIKFHLLFGKKKKKICSNHECYWNSNGKIMLKTVGEIEESPFQNFNDFLQFFEAWREREEGGKAAQLIISSWSPHRPLPWWPSDGHACQVMQVMAGHFSTWFLWIYKAVHVE